MEICPKLHIAAVLIRTVIIFVCIHSYLQAACFKPSFSTSSPCACLCRGSLLRRCKTRIRALSWRNRYYYYLIEFQISESALVSACAFPASSSSSSSFPFQSCSGCWLAAIILLRCLLHTLRCVPCNLRSLILSQKSFIHSPSLWSFIFGFSR